MLPFTTISGPAAPLLKRDIDTDVIIRVERLAQLPRGKLGAYAFEALQGPDFVLAQPAFRAAPILLAGANFGCGSSREAAVWALEEIGLRCVIAPSFGDIFYANCFQNGLLAVRLPEAEIAVLADQARDGATVTVDLRACQVTASDALAFGFVIDPVWRETLLEGLDELGLTLRRLPEIKAWQLADDARRRWARPRVTTGLSN
jgi:3-isopropylmalate/(R)-2-methylmalate dehydratase small subunit